MTEMTASGDTSRAAGTNQPIGARPSLPKMLVRGLFRRCAWCGGRGAFFDGWTGKHERCQSCGLSWRRDDVGYELGAAAVAAIICMGPLVVALGIVLAITWPTVQVVPLLVVFFVGALTLPVLLYPSSYTMWQAIDLLMRPAEPGDFRRPEASRTESGGSDSGRSGSGGSGSGRSGSAES